MLEGNNYVIAGAGDGLEVILVSLDSPATSAPAATTSPRPLVPQAQLRMQGPMDDVHVEIYGATVAEMLAAFGERYAVRYHGVPESSVITASFEGPLRRVLVRVLKGNDYVIKGSGNGPLEVILLSPQSLAAAAPAMPAMFVHRRAD